MLIPLLALALQAAATAIPAPAPVCTAAVAPPAGLQAWSKPAGGTGALVVGTARQVSLTSFDPTTFPLAPSRAPAPGTFGNVFTFTIAKRETYRIALSAGAWIDVVRGGKSLTSIAHTEGPACSGIRKIVDFDLAAGSYMVELSGARAASLTVLVVAK